MTVTSFSTCIKKTSIYEMIIIFIILIYILVIYFDRSLEKTQKYHLKILKPVNWNNFKFHHKTEYNNNLAKELLNMCCLSSCVYSKFSDLPTVYSISSNSFCKETRNVGIFKVINECLYVSLVSTCNLEDVCYSIDKIFVTETSKCGYSFKVHRGYFKKANEIYSSITKNTEYLKLKFNKVVLCGHSFGGVLATIVGYLFSKFTDFSILVYTFGSPKFGNTQMSFYVGNCKQLNIFNIINLPDHVVHKPSDWRFMRVGKEIQFDYDTGNDNVNHGIKVYTQLLNNERNILKRNNRLDEIMSKFVLDMLG